MTKSEFQKLRKKMRRLYFVAGAVHDAGGDFYGALESADRIAERYPFNWILGQRSDPLYAPIRVRKNWDAEIPF